MTPAKQPGKRRLLLALLDYLRILGIFQFSDPQRKYPALANPWLANFLKDIQILREAQLAELARMHVRRFIESRP